MRKISDSNEGTFKVKPIIGKKRKSTKRFISKIFSDYCSNTSIHGLGYLGADDTSLTEKIWWLTVFTSSVIACAFFINKTWTKWQNTPVVMGFSHTQTPIWEIPFPAVTVCPINKLHKSLYDYNEAYRNRENWSEKEAKKYWDVSLVCKEKPSQRNQIVFHHDKITNATAIESIIEVAPELRPTIQFVTWQGYRSRYTNNYFARQLTDDGLCFSFNSLIGKDMYTEQFADSMTFHSSDMVNQGWTIEDGYPDDVDMTTYPKRTARGGLLSGIKLELTSYDVDKNYFCNEATSGFKLLLQNPAESPRFSQHYIPLPADKRVTIFVTPKLVTTSKSVIDLPPKSRNCYFSYEKPLRFYKIYTETNCEIECLANVTQHLCQCVPFYSPRDNETDICGLGSRRCIQEAQARILEYDRMGKKGKIVEDIQNRRDYQIFQECDCLPSCFSLHYTAESSQTNYMDVIPTLEMTEVLIAFKENDFIAVHRSEVYDGLTDFLGTCGGLLGLFMGFSLLSLLEIIYFVTLRIWCRIRNKKNIVEPIPLYFKRVSSLDDFKSEPTSKNSISNN